MILRVPCYLIFKILLTTNKKKTRIAQPEFGWVFSLFSRITKREGEGEKKPFDEAERKNSHERKKK